MDIDLLCDIEDSNSLLYKIYDIIRVVDPLSKTVTRHKDDGDLKVSLTCFDFWEKNIICDNCIALRAYNDNRIFIKFEFRKSDIFMITAVPYDLQDRRLVAELLMDVTHSLELNAQSGGDMSHLHRLIRQLNSRVLKDDLTQVFNRRYVADKLPVDLSFAAFKSKGLSVIMADIDHFKSVNDTYGHPIGDKVLARFAAILSGCLNRTEDWVARYGGEEFIVCLPGAGHDKAQEIAERMRTRVENESEWTSEETLKITASFGVCTVRPTMGTDMDSVISCADEQLYLAKQSGRNRVMGVSEPPKE